MQSKEREGRHGQLLLSGKGISNLFGSVSWLAMPFLISSETETRQE
jgi:hypothetical protein